MRHFLQGAPLPVPRLPSRMGTPATPRLLIHPARSPLPLPLGQCRTGRRTISAPAVTGPTHKKLTPASGAATVDEIHAAASSPPGWTSSGPRAIQDPVWWVPLCTGSPSRARSANSGPSAYLGAVTFSPLRHHAWQHQPAPHDPPRVIRSPRRALRRSVPVSTTSAELERDRNGTTGATWTCGSQRSWALRASPSRTAPPMPRRTSSGFMPSPRLCGVRLRH